MTNYKYTLFFTLLLLLSCSSSEDVKPLNSVNIHTKNVVTFVNEKERVNAKLEDVSENKEILNSKSQNLKNSLINYPIKKSWQLDTNQIIDDENPYLPEPLFFDSNIFLLNNNGNLFKINSKNGKIFWKKLIFKDLKNTII